MQRRSAHSMALVSRVKSLSPARLCVVGACTALISGLAALPSLMPPLAADFTSPSVLVRVLGPADETTFRDTGEYRTIWSGEVEVPGDFTVTASSGTEYRLYVEGGRYLIAWDDRVEDCGVADDAPGATSVLAALQAASVDGGFSYTLSDAWFPGSGFYVTSVAGYDARGAVGWSYRVNNGVVAPTPPESVDRFLLGYDTSLPAPPHEELIIYWGYGIGCRPLRILAPGAPLQCGEPVEFTVEVFVDDGHSGGGVWEPFGGASLCCEGFCVDTAPDGTALMAFDEPGSYALSASAPYDGEYYYIPSEDLTFVDVEGPCRIISFTVQDHGDPGINFGLVRTGTEDNGERAQTADHGAVTLLVGAETNVDCELQLRGSADLQKTSGAAGSLLLSGFSWSTDPSADGAVPLTGEYVTAGASTANVETSLDIWHWLSVPADQEPDAYSGEFYYRIESSAP